MLTQLSIQNYALIDKMSVSFQNGFSIITGETGAGKSILLGGLGLILGKRADTSVINDITKKCIVEAVFQVENYKLQKIFSSEDIDYEEETIIRREILPSGKSRAFINDSPVSLNSLKRISENLIDIHSQHQTLQLTNNDFQFEVIDALAKNDKNLETYKSQLMSLRNVRKEFDELKITQSNFGKEEEYNNFLLQELLDANLDDIDQESLEQELEQLENVETIQEKLLQANQLLSDEQIGITTLLLQLKNSLKDISSFSSSYAQLYNRVESSQIELNDVFSEIESEQERVESDPERLHVVTSILNQLNSLQQKHQVSSLEELLVVRDELDKKVGQVANLSEAIKLLEEKIKTLTVELDQIAGIIHENRLKSIPKLTQQLEKIVKNLGMENAQFKISLKSVDSFLNNGKDELAFLFTANKGGSFNELKKSASGGELSRIMLGVKAVLSKYKKLPSIMFDEIDTGVSGEVADKMGLLMKYMSENMQVFSITHLPQIASKGQQHFKVFKADEGGVTKSNLKELTPEERIVEIAEMLGGKDLSETALNHAKELLKI
ncbi:DNA repair protein RecN [Pseudofulvibacter geojedonensis]|uniref:DNA repair protein RecN n=1 Tax=Pseudofulvibacter geojedonensis TaxID=1123758 RepID=A0ABW3HYZ6_9FLAO